MTAPHDPSMVTVYGRADGFAQTITVGRHRLTADEPVSDGIPDRDPTISYSPVSARERP